MSVQSRVLLKRNGRKNEYFSGTRRLFRYRLLVPILRGKHAPEWTARGVCIGLMVAMTPTVGIQMPFITILWLAMRWAYPKWDFNLIVAFAWTWVTNVFTIIPFYYLFFVTGRYMMGHWHIVGYEEFEAQMAVLLEEEVAKRPETFWFYVRNLIERWGAPMMIGSIPWALLAGWLGYAGSLRVIRRWHARREARNRARAAAENRTE